MGDATACARGASKSPLGARWTRGLGWGSALGMLVGTKHIGGTALALQGTLDTFSLPDVLKLLATTSKTGRLRIDGDRGQGSVWLRDGRVVDADADRSVDGAPTDEVVFELLRFGSGSFAFDADHHTPNAEHPDEVDDLLRRANALLSEWTELEAVVPSLDHRVRLTSELSSDDVTIDADRWRSLVAVAGGRSVGQVASSLGLSELNVSRAVRDLVELGVADVDTPEPIPDPGRLSDLPDLPSERPRRTGSRSRPTPPRGIPGLPLPGPSGRGSGEHVPGGERVPGGRRSADRLPGGRGDHLPEPALTGETPRAGWRQSDRTGGPQTMSPDGLPPPARATNGQDRPGGAASRPRRADSEGPPPPSAAPGTNGSRPGSRSGRGRSAPAPPAPDSPAPGSSASGSPAPDDTGSVARLPSDLPAAPADPGSRSRLPSDLPAAPSSLPGLPGLPDSSPLRDESSPFTGGGLVPPVDSITGQIRAVSSSALPPEMHWAADDDAPGGTTGPITSPFAGLSSLGRPRPGSEGERAPHLAAMSPEARAAVEAAVGPTGGSAGARSPSTGDDVAQRGRLINFLSSVR
jgi:hypothetical protein